MIAVLLLLLACRPDAPASDDTTDDTSPPSALPLEDAPVLATDDTLVALSAPRLLRRLSLDLRGVLPTVAELDAVEADPSRLTAVRDAYLADPRFEDRFMRLLAERWLTRVDELLLYVTEFHDLGMDPRAEYPFERAVGEEPLRLMARIAAEDRPWTDIVTANTTFANEVSASIWPVDYPAGHTGWEEVHYTDGRPAAGVLSTNGLWWRYYTTFSNYNRGRVAALSRLLLCQDYLARPVSFDSSVSLVDTDGIESALRTNPYCMGCHSSVDPIAATLFGFWPANEFNGQEMSTYHAEREPLGPDALGTPMAWFGTPVSGLDELGARIADDPRFARCAAQSAAEILWRRDTTNADFARIEALRQAYLAGGERMQPLLRAVTDTAVYRAGALTPSAPAEQQAGEATTRLVDATLLETVLGDLTGLDWVWQGYRMLDNDTYGFRIQGGGVDGAQVARPQRTPNLTWTLTVERASEGAGALAAARLGQGDALLHLAQPGGRPGEAAFDAQLDELHWRLYAERPDDAWRASIGAVWTTVETADGESAAWAAVVSAMLRDPLFVSY